MLVQREAGDNMTGFRRRNLRKKTDNDENDDADATVQPILNTAPQQSSIGAKLAALKKASGQSGR